MRRWYQWPPKLATWDIAMGHFWGLVVSAVALALAGCAGMSANECELANWGAVGYEDGARGRSTDHFGRYRKNCAKHAVAPDFQAYQSGREGGLHEYCQPTRGFQEGARGAKYASVCPANLEAAFLDSYFEGKKLHDLQTAVKSTNHAIAKRKSRMDDIEKELVQVMVGVLYGGTTDVHRATLIVETKQLAEERVRLENEVDDLKDQLSDEREDLAAHREQVASRT